MKTTYNVSSNPPTLQKIILACIAWLCFEIGVCPWPDLSSLFQYTSPTPVVALHLIPRIQYHPGIPIILLTGFSFNCKEFISSSPLILTDGIFKQKLFTSKGPFPLLLLYYSNMVDLENNGTSHQYIFKQVLCKAFSITYTTAFSFYTGMMYVRVLFE